MVGKLTLVAAFSFFLLLVLTWKESPKEATSLVNPIDLHVRQYSDSHITQNAVVKEERFSSLAFTPTKPQLLSSQLASVWRAIQILFHPKQTEVAENGTWLWTPTLDLDPSYDETILAGAQKNGVNTIYLSIDSYLDIYVMPESTEKEIKKKNFSDNLSEFIRRANDRGIVVDAEAGWRNWAEPGNEYKPLAILNFIKDFNANHSEKFRGLQYDIEPYLLDSYGTNAKDILLNYIKLVDKTVANLESDTLKFSVVIPDFYDKKDLATPLLYYGLRKDSVFGHLLNILEDKPGSTVIIMSYRNFADGQNGSIDISQNELRTAEKGYYSTNIILAQETGDVWPPFLTFYNTSKPLMQAETEKLTQAFLPNSNFGGLAIHYANAYLELR